MDSRSIRNAFTGFFAERGHEKVDSGPLVLRGDPTLMFANAGMVQFKDVFTGKDRRDYTRATTAQKCLRISGKHNDLENVGVTARHHTLFEMLGNFSFGDYFKKEAIEYAWELFTKVYGLDPHKMVITVFGGEEGYGPADDEAAQLWKDATGFGDERIIRCSAKDNFWQMGDTGPCGPCAEIHYCLGLDTVDPSTFGQEPDAHGRGWFELWNLVFMQYDRQPDGTLKPLPAPSVDTGAGLERIAVVMQDELSNYDTDLLKPIVQMAGEIAGKQYTKSQSEDDTSMRVIADHARATAFLISEGVFPDKSGESYVLRRVMRRAIRHGHRLGIHEPFLHTCAGKVVDLMGETYPQLTERSELIEEVSREEEERFRRTLDRGLQMIEVNEDWRQQGERKVLPGQVAFKLYDTYGFPLDLQDVIGREQGFTVDHDGFDAAMEEARERSQGSKVGSEGAAEVYPPILQALKDGPGPVRFVGYERETAEGTIVALIEDGAKVDRLEERDDSERKPAEIVATVTPFYGEKGGQAGDAGRIRVGDAVFVVTDTQIPMEGLVTHHGYVEQGTIASGAEAMLEVDHGLRAATRRNHSATHLLHWGLREALGPTATQKGSLVGPDRLRFDYSATKPLTAEEIARIEDMVNEAVVANSPITTEELPMDEAKDRGAIGIFEEKYGDVVRMLRIGPSLELCGGTHASRTGDIGLFTILSDSGLAAGVRRIEAATGMRSLQHLREVRGTVEEAAQRLKASPDQLVEKIDRLGAKTKELQSEVESLQKELASGGATGDPASEAREMKGIKVLGTTIPVGDPKTMRELADQLRDRLDPAVVLLGAPSKDGKKAVLVCSVSKRITDRFRAGDIVKRAAALVGGGGGGRPDFAQAGGSDPSKLGDAVAEVYEVVGNAP